MAKKKEDQERRVPVNPDLLISRELTNQDVARFGNLMKLALITDTSVGVTFDTARFVSGDNLSPGGLMALSDTHPDQIRQEQQGFTIEVGPYGKTDENGYETHFPTLGAAVEEGLQILSLIKKERKQKRNVLGNPDLLISRELTNQDVARFGKLMKLALITDTSVRVTFDTARFVSGDNLSPGGLMALSDTHPDQIRQEQQGFTIEVGPYGKTDENGYETHFPTLGAAVEEGLQILFQILTDEQSETEATKIFSSQFNM